MKNETNLIDGHLMNEFGEYARSAPLPIWVATKLYMNFEALGLYGRIASAASESDPEKMRVTISKAWAEALFQEDGEFAGSMSKIMDIGAITKVGYQAGGRIRLQVEAYPPDIRKKMNAYRRPDGRLVATFS